MECPTCGRDVMNKKFCPDCGTAVSQVAQSARRCPACQAQITASSVFCTECGHDMRIAASARPLGVSCPQCGRQNTPEMRFCGGCGYNLVGSAARPSGQYNQQPPPPPYQQPGVMYPPQQNAVQAYPPPQQQQYAPQQYMPQQYAQGGYQPQPMIGQPPMVLRCPTCMAMAPTGTQYCNGCRTNLAGVVPTPANMPAQGQQGGFLQSGNGKMAMGLVGGAAAVIGGEMLLNGLENRIEDGVEGDMGYGREHHRHHHHREEDRGPLGGLGELANDLGLF